MDMIFKAIPNLSIHQRIRDDDQVDQLHNYVTVYLLIISGLIIGVKELAGHPLDCWVTMEKYGHFQTHVNAYCWAHKLYHYPDMKNLTQMPKLLGADGEESMNDEDGATILNSYKWVTVVLIVQAVLFKIPDLLWSECNAESGTKMEQLVSMLKDCTLKLQADRKADLNVVAEFLELWLKLNGRREDLVSGPEDELAWCFEGNKRNRFLSTMYMVVKVCYLVNLLVQFLLLTLFLEFDFWHYGLHLLDSDGEANQKYFPLTGLCNFRVKGATEWVQCILLMNMLVEKIFMVQWLWFVVLLAITIINLVSWVPRIFRQETALRFIRRYLRILCKEVDGNRRQRGRGSVRHFVCHYLGQDGVFVLRILSINTSSVAMAELMQCLWYRYQDDQKRPPNKDSSWACEEDKARAHKERVEKDKDREIEMRDLHEEALGKEAVTLSDEGETVNM